MDKRLLSTFDFEIHPTRPVPKWKIKYPIRRATAISLDPDTVLLAATSRDLKGLLKQHDYTSYRVLMALLASLERGSNLQKGTQSALAALMTPRSGEIARPLSVAELVSIPQSLASPWRLLFRTMRRERGPLMRGLLVRLAWGDRVMHQLSAMHTQASLERKKLLFQSGLKYWHEAGFLSSDNAWETLLLDEILGHLAWADLHLQRRPEFRNLEDPVIFLSRPGVVPMRNWFNHLLKVTSNSDLVRLCDFLTANAAPGSKRLITHLELKQWATEKKPLPEKVALQILTIVETKNELAAALLRHQLWGARLISFLIAFVQGFAKAPVDEEVAQQLIFARLQQRKERYMGDPLAP